VTIGLLRRDTFPLIVCFGYAQWRASPPLNVHLHMSLPVPPLGKVISIPGSYWIPIQGGHLMFGKSGDQMIDRKYIHIYQSRLSSLTAIIGRECKGIDGPCQRSMLTDNSMPFALRDRQFGMGAESRLCLMGHVRFSTVPRHDQSWQLCYQQHVAKMS
jgi:hypothetical protein